MSHEIKLERRFKGRLDKSDEMRNKQYENSKTLGVVRKIRTDLSIKKNKTLIKKKRNRSRYKSKEVRIKIIVSDIYETRETIIYKELSRRPTLQEMNTTK